MRALLPSGVTPDDSYVAVDISPEEFSPWLSYNNEEGFIPKLSLILGALILLPVRIALAVAVFIIYFILCKITLIGCPEPTSFEPLPPWRRSIILLLTRCTARTLLFLYGFYWIQTFRLDTEPSTPRDSGEIPLLLSEPPIEVSNHVSYLDILYLMYNDAPSFVAKGELLNLPMIGTLVKAYHGIFVNRKDTDSRKKVLDDINRRAATKGMPPLLIFPEGTTTNGLCLARFNRGAFVPGQPVRPIVLQYPYFYFNPSWVNMDGTKHVLRMLCTWFNRLKVYKLPVYYPSEKEKEDVELFAENVRQVMAEAALLRLSSQTYKDKFAFLHREVLSSTAST